MLASLVQDVRVALRTFARRPGFTAVALVTLALGIGANTAVFSVVNGILLTPLPYTSPDRVVAVWPDRFLSQHDLLYLREHTGSYTSVAGLVPSWNMTLTGSGEPAKLRGARTTANLFATLGVSAALGRTFGSAEEAQGANAVVLLSHALWRGRFGGDSSVIGRRLMLDGQSHTVVGVMAAGFEVYQPRTQIWKPLSINHDAWYYRGGALVTIARLSPGVPVDAARRELRSLTTRMREALGYPDAYGSDADVVPLRLAVADDLRPTLLMLLGAVGFILLIAGGNLAQPVGRPGSGART